MVASSRGLIAFVRELISRGADIQAEDSDNWTALLNAAKNGHFDILQLLIEHGADYEHRDMVSNLILARRVVRYVFI